MFSRNKHHNLTVYNKVLSRKDMTGQKASKHPFLIGIAGGTCCGKSEVCSKICQHLGENSIQSEHRRVIILGHKSFYRQLTNEEKTLAEAGKFNFDHPSAFDDDLALDSLKQLKKGNIVKIPKYNEITYSREEEYQTIYPLRCHLNSKEFLSYTTKKFVTSLTMKIFVDTDSDTRLARRVLRDTVERNRNIDSVLDHYTKFVKRSFEDFTLPTKKYADVIIPRGADNSVAIDLIVEHIHDLLGGQPNTRKRTISESSGGRPH